MKGFPAAPSPAMDAGEHLHRLLPNMSEHIRGIHYHESSGDTTVALGPYARLTANAPWSIDTRHQYWTLRVAAKRLMRQLNKERAWQPLDLSELLGQNLPEMDTRGELYTLIIVNYITYIRDNVTRQWSGGRIMDW